VARSGNLLVRVRFPLVGVALMESLRSGSVCLECGFYVVLTCGRLEPDFVLWGFVHDSVLRRVVIELVEEMGLGLRAAIC